MSDIREICSLSEEDLQARRRELRESLLPQVRRRSAMPDGVALTFDATPERQRELEDFVAFERGCCPSLRFELCERAGELQLEIHGLDPGSSIFRETPDPGAPAGASGLGRAARAGALGTIGAFALLCGVPIALAALIGAKLAAPLGVLDHPLALALGSILLAGVVWRWERGRA